MTIYNIKLNEGVLCCSYDHSEAGLIFIDILVLKWHYKKKLRILYVSIFFHGKLYFPILTEKKRRKGTRSLQK